MVEIAIALAVIAFALVAIIGVLPTGMNVQKENRQETIINQDASVFIDAIRSGARGLDDLTNYVIYITNTIQAFQTTPTQTNALGTRVDNLYTYSGADLNGSTNQFLRLTNGARIIGLLSTPRYDWYANNGFYSNYVVAQFRALSGAASEKFPQKDANLLNLSFAYRLIPEVSPVPTLGTNAYFLNTYDTNLHELRLSFRWPVFPNGTLGNGRQTFRTLAGGRYHVTDFNLIPATNSPGPYLNFLQPSTFNAASEY